MGKSVLSRIEELERQKPSSIICLAKNVETGEIKEMPMRELAEKFDEWRIEKVIDGNDLDDLDAYLEAFRNYAKYKEHEEA